MTAWSGDPDGVAEPSGGPGNTPAPSSYQRFPDGRSWRLEIPSVEGPAALEAVLDEADRRGLRIDRVSQGSGIELMLDREIQAMVQATVERGIHLSLFIGPRGGWDIGASVLASGGGGNQIALRGQRQLDAAMADVDRAVGLGVRGVLVGDIGLLALLGRRRLAGELPAEFAIKWSVVAAPANPSAAAVLASLGADSINIHSDHPVSEIAEFRQAMDAAIDVYVEAPDNLGGFVRYHEIPEFVRVGAPVYLKFGLRNAVGTYPAGLHLQAQVEAGARERVRRAEIGLEHLARAGAAESS